MIAVEVVYDHPERLVHFAIQVPQGTTASQLIVLSGLDQIYSELADHTHAIGIFGKATTWEHPMQAGDRLEIYQPLRIDPKQARRFRAAD